MPFRKGEGADIGLSALEKGEIGDLTASRRIKM
jgi:hypothetical protein